MSETEDRLRALLETAARLASALGDRDDESAARVRARLRDSVVRPLRQATHSDLRVDGDGDTGTLPDRLWGLARAATALRVAHPDLPLLAEATAALQDLAIQEVSGPAEASDRASELAAMQSGLPPGIQVAADGPYLVTNARQMVDWLGQQARTQPQLALCRCGKSGLMPFCDGTHATSGFTGAKDPNRVPDRRDTYVGQQVTILDNRGICQHAGFCTDRLATVFHSREEPFVTPSGGRMDEIIRAVRDCPSGALGYAVDGTEARASVDHHGTREPDIEVSKDGPYRITGGIPLTDSDGADVPRAQGASLEHYALCRCGQSQNKPFCSGMHWYVEFHDPVPDAEHEPTMFEWAGGLPALTRMTRVFYEKYVPQDPLLAPLFATMSADHPERVAKWLGEVFGGPKAYSSEYGGYPRMLSQHVGKCLSEEQRVRWVALIQQSARDAGLPNDPEFRSAFSAYIEWGSRLAVENSQTHARPPQHMPMPHWDWSTAAGPPGSRISALAPSQEEEPGVPQAPPQGEPVSFQAHIKPLFRPQDQRSMSFVFDLWSYDDVSAHADAIADRLRAGTMPCDGAWPQDRLDLFQRWLDDGRPR
jgi:CDGSH-type Zn-finger protein/truncated hemoglobin YjbI